MAKNAHIMMAATKNYIIHCIETLHSLKVCCPDHHLTVHLVVDCAEDETSSILQQISFLDGIDFKVYTCSTLDQFLPSTGALNLHLTKMTYARCFSHRYLDAFVSRFLWIDADVLFCSSNASSWLDSPFNYNFSIAVKDPSVINFDQLELRNTRSINYANAGIMAYDLDAMRRYGACNRFEKFFADIPQWYIDHNISDETVVNYVLNGFIKFIDGAFNVQSIMLGYPQYDEFARECGYADQIDMVKHTVASHMMGAKPWDSNWNTWQAWQVPLKTWQKAQYERNCQQLQSKYGEKYLALKALS